MPLIIPENIGSAEKLVYFLFNRDFRKNIIHEEKLETKNIFYPNKGGVSLQRASFCGENECKSRALKICGENRYFVGFCTFTYSTFKNFRQEYKLSRSDFEADIFASPLDSDNNVIEDRPIYSNQSGNPAHADLIYINPAVLKNENPNTAIRSFSRKFSKLCTIHLDQDPKGLDYLGLNF